MTGSKHIDKICVAVIAVTLVITLIFMTGAFGGISAAAGEIGYESRIFSTDTVHQIDIVMDDWDEFISTCENEEYTSCTAIIDGEKYSNIGIRAKGNTSLSNVSSMDSQRYSFKVEFDQYQKGNTYHGLDKLCLNNLIQDNTMMKDYLVYQMMAEFGVETPLCSYAYITVNGEDWGLYLAVEGVEDSFLERNYGSETGEMYKPDSMSFGGGRGNGKDFDMKDFEEKSKDSDSDSDESREDNASENDEENGKSSDGSNQMPGGFGGGNMPEGFDFSGEMPEGFDFSGEMPEGFDFNGEMPEGFSFDGNMPGGNMPSGGFGDGNSEGGDISEKFDGGNFQQPPGGFTGGNKSGGFNFGGGFGMGSDDVKLKYSDDDFDSYSNIFNSAKTDISKADKKRLIEALKNLTEYNDLEDTVNIEEVLRYFVIHNFVCNSDSYTGTMIHNYYLHESDGQLSMIPWDYNLAFGTFTGGDASSTVNKSIDNPVDNGSVDDRPMVGWIFSDESYTNQYHELFEEFISEWFDNGKLEQLINNTVELITPYVEKDPTKFCTTEEFESGVKALCQFVSLRAEAVSRQLSGDDTTVDTDGLNLSDMGTMNSGGGGFGGPSRNRGSDSEKGNSKGTGEDQDSSTGSSDSGTDADSNRTNRKNPAMEDVSTENNLKNKSVEGSFKIKGVDI